MWQGSSPRLRLVLRLRLPPSGRSCRPSHRSGEALLSEFDDRVAEIGCRTGSGRGQTRAARGSQPSALCSERKRGRGEGGGESALGCTQRRAFSCSSYFFLSEKWIKCALIFILEMLPVACAADAAVGAGMSAERDHAPLRRVVSAPPVLQLAAPDEKQNSSSATASSALTRTAMSCPQRTGLPAAKAPRLEATAADSQSGAECEPDDAPPTPSTEAEKRQRRELRRLQLEAWRRREQQAAREARSARRQWLDGTASGSPAAGQRHDRRRVQLQAQPTAVWVYDCRPQEDAEQGSSEPAEPSQALQHGDSPVTADATLPVPVTANLQTDPLTGCGQPTRTIAQHVPNAPLAAQNHDRRYIIVDDEAEALDSSQCDGKQRDASPIAADEQSLPHSDSHSLENNGDWCDADQDTASSSADEREISVETSPVKRSRVLSPLVVHRWRSLPRSSGD